MTKIEFRLAFSVVSIMITGMAVSQEIGEEIKEAGPESCNGPGRYQVVIHPTIRADQYLVDTCLGRVWKQIEYTDLGKTVWYLSPRVDSDEERTKWVAQELLKNEKK